jgi:hypothetical protein
MPSEELVSLSNYAWFIGPMMTTAKLTASPVPSSRRRDLERVAPAPATLIRSIPPIYPTVTKFDFVHRKVVPSTQIRCSTTPSLRASATRARFRPRRLATWSAQCFKLENRVVRVSITLAASYSAVRSREARGLTEKNLAISGRDRRQDSAQLRIWAFLPAWYRACS